MRPALKAHLERELRDSSAAEASGDIASAWRSLERAHVLSQAHAWPHVRVHGLMFGFAWRRRRVRELIGQAVRILVAGPGSLLGRAPLGNTGGSDVGMFTPVKIPDDLQAMLQPCALSSSERGTEPDANSRDS